MKTSKTHLKKALFILIIFLMSLAKVMAQSFTFGDLIYSVNSDSTSVTVTGHVNGSSATGSLIIPENVTHEGSSYAVTAIGNYAFRNSGFTGDLTVPNSVTWIGNSAFQNCSTFSSVHFYAVNCTCSTSHPPFYNCGGILTIGDNVESIPAYIFKEAAFTGSLTIGNSVTSIGTEAFCNCTGFTGSLVINSAVTTIGHRAFQQCSGFNGSLIIGSSVSSIGISAFKNCSGFSEVQYNATNAVNNNGIDSNGPFIGCTGALVIGENVETIPNYLFNYAAFTGDLTIPNSVISIGQSAFRGCSSFDGTLTIGESVTWMGSYAFWDCSGFTDVHYNATNCEDSSYSIFQNCSGTIVIGENVERIPNHMFQNAAFTGTLTIPNSVTSLGQSAFNNCNGLTGLTLSNSITTICGSAFKNCSGFTGSLTIPNSVTSIGGSAFQNCSSFTEVHYNATNCGDAVNKPFQDCGGTLTIGENVERIPKEMFQNAAFTGVLTIPSQITSIGKDAFKLCNGFTEVHYNAINCADLGYGDTPFVNCSGTLTIGENVERIPKSMFYGAAFTGNLVIPNSVTEIGMVAFRDCTGFTGDLIIPNSVTTIERESFSGCSGFTGNLVIPNSVTSINIWAFRYCSGFTGSLIIPNSVTSIGEYAFNGCSGFTEVHYNATNCASGSQYSTFGGCGGTLFIGENVERIPVNMFKSAAFSGHLTIPNSVTSIGSRAFEYCSSLTSLTIPNSISSIGQETFCGCSGLISVSIPNSITSIGNSAFSGCSGLTSISIPNSVTSIGGAAFSGCSGLTSLTIPNSVTSINTGAFKNCIGLEQIDVDSGNTVYDSRENCNAIIRTNTNELITACTNSIIPNSVTSIGSYAFFGLNSLTTISIPNFVTSIGYQAFYNCNGLTTMTVFAETPPSLSSEVFYNVSKDIPVYVPIGTIEAYQNAYGWNEFTNYIELGETLVFQTHVDEDVYGMNTSIPIHGTVTGYGNVPVANMEVEIGVFVMGMRRSLQATTNASGEFSATFEPMPSESGYYTVNSGRVGNNSTAVHDDFNIPGMSVITDGYILCLVTQDQPKTDSIQLRNKSNLPLNNIQISVLSAPEGCSISFMPLSLDGMETADLVFTVNGTELTQGNQYQEIKLRAISSEGASADFSIWYYCKEPKGILNIAPNSIATTMTKGKSKIVDVMLSNHGTAATGEISINLPEVEWLSVVGSSTLPSIPVNDSAFFSLRLSPNEDIQLGQYSGAIAISCEHGEFASLPYQITAVSDSTGTLVVDVTDEYTWNTNGGFGPHLANAEVTLTSYFSLETVAHGYTNEDGIFNVEQLPEGYYKLHVSADRHSEYDNVILIEAGVTNQRNVFVQYQGVTYSWEVIPTEIQDEYTYELNVVYETNVPVPVITIDYSGIHDLEFGESANCNLIFTNHGLISAYETQIYFSPSNEYTFIPLYDMIDTLPAQTTVVVPCYYYRSENEAKESSENCDIHCLSVSIYYCNNDRQMVSARSKPFPLGSYEICYHETIWIIHPPILPPIEIIPPVIPWIDWPDCPFCPHIDVDVPPTTEEHFCTPCLEALGKSIVGCIPGGGLGEGLGECMLLNGIMDYNSSNQQQILDQLSCIINELAGEALGSVISCVLGACQNLGNCVNIEFHADKRGNVDFIQNTINGLYYSSLYFANELSLAKSFFPEDVWDDEENIVEFLDEVKALTNATTGLISENDAQQLASTFIGTSVTYDDIMAFVNRWNRSLEYWSNGYYMISDLPEGYNTDFVQIDTDMINEMLEVEDYFSLLGYENMAVVYSESLEDANTIIGNTSQSNVCAKITVQFSQKMTMTREAFEGTFSVHNGNDENSMEGIGLNFMVKDEDGNDCTDLFQINTTSLTNLTGIDGSGSLDAGMDGMAKILFIPTKAAAPTEPKVYYFGGTFSFIDPYTSDELVYDLYPVDLTVHPSPDLYVDYFMQRDILGDDALTLDKVEPSIPAELGVIINNKGAGVAKNVILETAEPKIVDNEKGLAIDFAMYGASFNGNEAQLGLMAIPFGNIESGHTAVGEWLFTSSLLGHFVSYEAHVIHNNSYGNPDLSLVSHLDIHELIHPIRAYGDLDDSINDFLVNDVADFHDYPDSIYFSNGGRTGVGLVDDIHFNHYVSPQDTIVILTINPSRVGWNYGVTDDPGSDKYELVSCTRRTDNQVIPMHNIWQTFVTLNDEGDPTYENKLHIVDTLSNDNFDYTYTLVYSKKKELLKVEEIIGIPESDFIEYPLESFSVKFNKPIADSTFTYEDMVLKCNNGSNLMNATVDISKIDDDKYDVNIAGLTYQTGYYVLNVNTLNINDTQGYAGYEGKQATWIQVLNGDVFVHINGDQTICDNDAFEPLTSVVVGEYNTLQWKRDGVSITGANGLQYQPSESGIYTLTVAFENGEVLTSNEVTLVSNPINEVYINDEICEGDEYILNDFIMTGLSAGIYNETLYLENLHHCDSIVSTYLVVHESPEVHIQIDTINQNGISFRLTAIGADNYEWSTGETTASIIVSPINPTTFSVVGTNSNGCSDSDEVIVSGGTGINDNQTTNSAIIFPNPAHNKLFIKTSSAVNAVEIFSITGTLVHKQSSNSDTIEIDVQHISSGMYFIRLIANHSVETMRFVKE